LDSQVISAFSSPLILPKNAKDVLVSDALKHLGLPLGAVLHPLVVAFVPSSLLSHTRSLSCL
jgi:hypothetical protein